MMEGLLLADLLFREVNTWYDKLILLITVYKKTAKPNKNVNYEQHNVYDIINMLFGVLF